jgi:hypothetical protein
MHASRLFVRRAFYLALILVESGTLRAKMKTE